MSVYQRIRRWFRRKLRRDILDVLDMYRRSRMVAEYQGFAATLRTYRQRSNDDIMSCLKEMEDEQLVEFGFDITKPLGGLCVCLTKSGIAELDK